MVRLKLARFVIVSSLLLAAASLQASDFNERLAKWNVGPASGNVRQAAYDEPIDATEAPAALATRAASPQTAQITAPSEPMSPPSMWQEMAFGQHGGYGPPGCASCGPAGCGGCGGGGCDGCGGPGACGQGCCSMPGCWCSAELLFWWRKGQPLPPLVTTDPVTESSDTAGILPNATILFGNGSENTRVQAGGRIDFGWWLDPHQCWGIGNRFFGLGRDDLRFQSNNLANPILAIPFFNVDDNLNDALIVAYPGLRSGSIDFTASSEVFGNDLYARLLFCRGCFGRIDLLAGYNFTRFNEDLHMRSRIVVTGGAETVGTEVVVFDRFATRNEFHGALIGLSGIYDCGGCWSLQGLAKISIGSIHQRAIIDGSNVISVPGQPTLSSKGGLFTAESNIGTFSRTQFTAITELGLTLGYKIAPCTQLTVGYTFMYWNDALRPGELIDPQRGTSTAAGTRPRFEFDRSDFWVQGINLGLSKQF